MKAIRLFSDNFEGELLTEAAYQEATLQMSTGDFHTHRKQVVRVKADTEIMDVADLYGGALPENLQDLYAGHVKVLKQKRSADGVLGIVVYAHTELRYFKNGRANMHVRTSYSVEVWHGMAGRTENPLNWCTRKADAFKAFTAACAKYNWGAK